MIVEKEENKQKKLPDPISVSIQERKDYGSYLSVVKTAKGATEFEPIKFEVKGIPDTDLKKPAEKYPEPSTVLSKSFLATPGRRSLKDRKKSNKEQ